MPAKPAEPDPTPLPDEDDAYWQARYTFAKRVGFDRSHARAFAASEVPMSELRDLLAQGCSVRLAERITRPLP